MNTGLTSVSKLTEITAAYPFAGMEVAFAIGILVFFLAFIVRQVSMEAHHHKSIIGTFTASPAE